MAGRKSNNKNGFKSGRGISLRLILNKWFWLFVLMAAAAGTIYWQWGAIIAWIDLTASTTMRIFGWGLGLIVAALVNIIILIYQRKASTFIRHANRWLGGLFFLFFVWGILAFITPGSGVFGSYSLGGQFGRSIIGFTGWEGAWRLLGLLILGIGFIAPKASLVFAKASVLWLVHQLKQPGKRRMRPIPPDYQGHGYVPEPEEEPMAAPQTIQHHKPVPPPIPLHLHPDTAKPAKTRSERKKEPAGAREDSTPQELKQVAQEVWKKYGESPNLVTVNGWKLPPIDILDYTPEVQFSQADNAERARLIEEALASYGVETKVIQINAGPTVTQFGLEPGWDRRMKEVREKDKDGNVQIIQKEISKTRVKVDRISSLANDLALALAAPSIRIEAPVPGKSIVGIEVPNTIASMVSLRGVIETNVYQKLNAKIKLALALGKGAGGEAISADMARMPHLLIAGSTGSGKTVCLNAIVCCLLMNNSPSDVRFIMIDPKRVELTTFNSIPHLAGPVIVEPDRALMALRGLSREMNERYQELAKMGARNIESYNKSKQGNDKMPYLVLIIDELADLMALGGDEVEQILCRLAQLSRAVGIHLVVATQRPSVDVVTGLIKANFPTRISFAVTSQVDSRTILDFAGAEKLLGSGDMLYMPTEASKPKRLQGCYVSDAEMERLVYFWGSQQQEQTVPTLKIEEMINAPVSASNSGHPEDALIDAARQLALEHDTISTSFLQRRLHIGYPRAARIMEQIQAEMNAQDEGEEEENIYDEVEGGEGDEAEEFGEGEKEDFGGYKA